MQATEETAKSIFLAALDIPQGQKREAFLADKCGDNATLRADVEGLLRHQEVGSFLEVPPSAIATSAEELRQSLAEEPSLGFLGPSSRPGSLGRLGHYEILEIVGYGGMGSVLKAFDEKLQRVVAIKVMAEALAASAPARRRFAKEAQAAAAIRSDHIVNIHAVEDSGPIPYIVMELISGVSLRERLEKSGPLKLREILRIGMQIAQGLAAAHAQGVVHRDIKPANILLENGVERVKITDFGLARVADEASVSQSGVIAGTPQYMAPEQARGEAVDCRADLFSLGSVLYAMCTGRPPFRASTTLAVLKRVCEDHVSPIREANPDIPNWLVELIDKLHAKDPVERYQTASEVAELLSQGLARVQQDTAPPLPATKVAKSPIPNPKSRMRQRWALAAAAAVVLLFLGISLTEATGVTQVVPTVIRIFTPEGTLVIEASDPDVKVTIEGDGGLSITTAGGQQVRLPAGISYKLRAAKDGKPVPLDRELVTITQGGKHVVRVRLESPPNVETGAFVVLGGPGVAEREFDTLAEAVRNASDGDTIEIRGNGAFVTQPIKIGDRALTIRAGNGSRPVIKGNADPSVEGVFTLLFSEGPLVLEGLELHMKGPVGSIIVDSQLAPLHIANCRFVLYGSGHSVAATDTPVCKVRNCEFSTSAAGHHAIAGHHVIANLPNDGKLTLENNLLFSPFGHALDLQWRLPDLHNVSIHLKHNTVEANCAILHGLISVPESAELGVAPDRQPVEMDVSANVFESINPTDRVLSLLLTPDWFDKDAKPLSVEEAERLLSRFLAWREERNLYCKGLCFQSRRRADVNEPLPACQTLADWQRMWNASDSGSLTGIIRYEGGDVISKMEGSPELLTAADFRLRPNSAGYRAGKDGKDLGVDVDLVGPGAAYERWKKTPEYQQWLKETGQAK